MGRGGAAILLAARGLLCAAAGGDLPTAARGRGRGEGGLPPGPWARGAPRTPLPAPLGGRRRERVLPEQVRLGSGLDAA